MQTALPTHLIQRRLLLVSLPHPVLKSIFDLYTKWTEANGIEWTVKRFKNLKQDFLTIQSDPDAVVTTPWVKLKNPRRPSGPIGYLFRKGVVSKEVISVFNIFTCAIATEMTPSQREKFVNAVTKKGQPTPDRYMDLIRKAAYKFRTKEAPKDFGIPRPLILRSPMRESHEKRFLK